MKEKVNIRLFSELNKDMALGHIMTFLEVAEHEGINQVELAKNLNASQGLISRTCKELSKYRITVEGEKVTKGYDLIKLEPDLDDRRCLSCYLTQKGRELYDRL